MNDIAETYAKNLWKHAYVLNYLALERKLKPYIIQDYKIGYAEKILQPKNGLDSLFNGCITFPVFDGGDVVSLYGRRIKGAGPKHMLNKGFVKNLPYNSKNLSKDALIVVESPIDSLILEQNGFFSVALFGVGLSKHMIPNFKNKIVYLLFDSDEAGKRGAKMAASKLFVTTKEVHILDFPSKNTDVNSFFIRENNASEILKNLVKNSCAIKAPRFTRYPKIEKNKKIENLNRLSIVEVGKLLFPAYLEKSNGIWVRCPHHKNGSETERSLWIGGDKNIFYCFGCQVGGKAFKLVQWHLDLSVGETIAWFYSQQSLSIE